MEDNGKAPEMCGNAGMVAAFRPGAFVCVLMTAMGYLCMYGCIHVTCIRACFF